MTREDDDATRAMAALRRTVRALRIATRANERELGISSAQLFVLRQLSQTPGLSLSDLADRTLTTQSTISEVVARLVDRGLVSRRAAPDDRRRAELSATESGDALLARASQTVQERLLDGLHRLPPDARRVLADALEAWLAASGLSDIPATMFFDTEGEKAGTGNG